MEVSSEPRASSLPTLVVTPVPVNHTSRKRKHVAISGGAAPSPAPSDPGVTPTPSVENVVLPRHLDLSTRPRLTVSRHPQFIPESPGSPYYNTEPLCMNRLNFRYTPAGLSPIGSVLPFTTIEAAPTCFRVSWEDRSAFIKATLDGLGLKGEKGFRSARCNAPVREGKWYMEVKIEQGGGEKPPDSQRLEGSYVRLGWARREAPLNGPAGLDGYSYSYRDKTGDKVHLSRPRPYGKPFKSGDVIGMYISLPSPRRAPNKKDPYDPAHIKRERIAIEFKGQEYFESLEYPQSKEMMALVDASDRAKATKSGSMPSSASKKSATVKNLPSTSRGAKTNVQEPAPLRPIPTLGPDSYIAFFINGESQGVAFQDLFDYLPLRSPPNKQEKQKKANKDGLREHKENPFDDGTLGYYPFISLFNEARVRMNPGPDFEFPPPPDIDAALSSVDGNEADIKPLSPQNSRTWRPLCERYPEFFAEQKALDSLEEKEARQAAQKNSEQDKATADKAEAQKARRRAQAAARKEKKAKQVREEAEARRKKVEELQAMRKSSATPSMLTVEEGMSWSAASPSIQSLPDASQYTASGPYSPAPTVASSVDLHGLASHNDSSAYNSEYEEEEREGQPNADSLQHDDSIGYSLGEPIYMYRERVSDAPGIP